LHSANQITVLINLAHQLFSLAAIGLIPGAVPAIIFHCAPRSPTAGKWLPSWLLLPLQWSNDISSMTRVWPSCVFYLDQWPLQESFC